MSLETADSWKEFWTELRLSTRPVIIGLLIASLLFDLMDEKLPALVGLGDFPLYILVFAVIVFLIQYKSQVIARLSLLAGLCVGILILDQTGVYPNLLSLLAVPLVMAAFLLNVWAALALGIVLTAVLPFWSSHTGHPVQALLWLLWILMGILACYFIPFTGTLKKQWQYFLSSRRELEEGRARKAQLNQALEDLEYLNRQHTLINKRLVAMRAIAEEAHKSKATFVAKVSHEFRTPLNMIIGLVDLIVENPEVYNEPLPPALMRDLWVVYQNCQHLSNMVNDVLELSQAEAGRLVLQKERVDLAELIQTAVTVVSPLLEKKKLTCQIHIAPDLPRVYCDRTRIRQVILNLIGNAVRYTPSGGITLRAGHDEHFVSIHVQDTGPGIAAEELEKLFDPFFQGLEGLREGSGGSGLGLSISKQFIDMHGGRIWAESSIGQGSTFSFRLPISPDLSPASGPTRWINETALWTHRMHRHGASEGAARPRFLLCDPEGNLTRALQLTTDKIEFVRKQNLSETISEVEQCPAHLVILPAPLSEMTGRALPFANALLGTPILACGTGPDNRTTLGENIASQLVKPFCQNELLEAVDAIPTPVHSVLIVENDSESSRLMTRMLLVEHPDWNVLTAETGRQALDCLWTASVDLILLNVMAPEVDGWEFMKKKNLAPRLLSIPVILVTAQDLTHAPFKSEAVMLAAQDGLTANQVLQLGLFVSSLLLEPE